MRLSLSASHVHDSRSDRGAALVEILVSVVLLGTLGIAVLGAATASASAASVNRSIADTQAALSSTGDALMDVTDPDANGVGSPDKIITYVSCLDEPDNSALIAIYQAQVDQILVDVPSRPVVTVASVSYWNGTGFGVECRFAEGHRLQEVVLQAQGSSGPVRELRVLRRPFSVASTASSSAVTTTPSGDSLAFEPTPGIGGPETTMTTTTTTTSPTTTTTTTTSPATTTTTSPAATTTTTTSPATTTTTSPAATTTTSTTTTGPATTTTTTTTEPPPVDEDPIVCSAASSSEWRKRSEVRITLTNSGVQPVTAWRVFVALPDGASAVTDWNNTVAYVTGGFEASNKYDVNIAPGASTDFRFQFDHSNWASRDFDFTCRDAAVNADGSPSGSDTPTSPDSKISCSVTANVYGDKVQLDVAVTNSSSSKVQGWRVFIPIPAGASIVNHWSSSPTRTADGIEVSPANWNKNLNPGQSATFGIEYAPSASGRSYPCSDIS